MAGLDALLARSWVRSYTKVSDLISRRLCYGLYDGDNLKSFRASSGETPVLLAIPPMSDVNGALPHPGVRVLQTVLRDTGVPCEVLNYNLPCTHPREPFDHLIRTVRTLGVRILGVSTYSQAIRSTLEGLRRVREACPDLHVVLGGPHPTESYLSLMGVSFIDYVCRGEAEESFPRLVAELLAGRRPLAGSIPGVFRYDRERDRVEGRPAPFIDLARADRKQLLRHHFSPEELKQQRLYRGSHGMTGAEYWPVALVRGCPYDCTFCAAYQMSGKKLRYRDVGAVVDDLEFYMREYGRRHFSFIDDAFTQSYGYVVDLCREIMRRGLGIYWTTDNGIRYETLGAGRSLRAYLEREGIETVDALISLMIRAGWRGTAVGIESGSDRVRRELVRKGGAHLTNDEIVDCLRNLKRIARREGAYFYVNGFLMAGFPRLPLKNGRVIAAETKEEMRQTADFARQLRDSGAIDMMNLSMVIPLPGSDTWDCLTIGDKLDILLSCVPTDQREAGPIRDIEASIRERYREDPEATRYDREAEAAFWRQVYRLPDEAQILIMQSYDAFNADAAHEIHLDRPDPQYLWSFRETVVSEFYGSLRMKMRMIKHVVHRSSSLQDAAAYLTLLGRKYDPDAKHRATAAL